jgi:hypothetical protein
MRISANQNQQDQAIANRHIAGAGVSPPVTAMTHKPAPISGMVQRQVAPPAYKPEARVLVLRCFALCPEGAATY